jgi:hypothetical protein
VGARSASRRPSGDATAPHEVMPDPDATNQTGADSGYVAPWLLKPLDRP